MRKLVQGLLIAALVAMAGCVTINVYFPEAAAQKAADQFIGNVLDSAQPAPQRDKEQEPPRQPAPGTRPAAMLLDLLIPAAYAADTPNLRVQTATTDAIQGRMQQRFRDTLGPLFDSGALGFTLDGLVAVRDAGKVPLAQRAGINASVADENRDRNALYREVANANNHPEWEAQIRATFAKGWIERAKPGWYYQDASGAWKKK
ncbi:MAG TPA: YdbL family protein [Dyella sp.]|uniref:YdbL family protein n=1 Tax=Dyella sp. TaxID=1869338 RepID=UPI002F94E73B